MTTQTTTTSSTRQQNLTKKQKKALAFRDKSNKSKKTTTGIEDKHELTQMADLHVPLMEESRRNRSAGDQVQMGDLEGKIKESARGGGEKADESPAGAHHVVPPKQKQKQWPGDHSQQESQWAASGGDYEHDGERPRQGKHTGEGGRAGTGKHAREEERAGERKHTREGERTGKGNHTREKGRTGKGNHTREGERTREEERSAKGERKSEKQGRKRKREQLDDGLDEPGIENGTAEKKNKKRKGEKVEPRVDHPEEEREEREGEEEMSEGGGEDKKRSGKGGEKQRLILFIGNLKYTTSIDTIKAHFFACDPPPEVRLLTPKASTSKSTTKSKGCAFLEFKNRTALQQALKLHHSMLEGRMVNVELTAGGGGKGEKRMEKLKERNKALLGQRKRKAEKADKKDESFPSRPDKPQRYSATSGMEQSSPEKKRTWTVGDVVDDEVHRGGQNHKKSARTRGSRKSKMKDWATGVNAIPVT